MMESQARNAKKEKISFPLALSTIASWVAWPLLLNSYLREGSFLHKVFFGLAYIFSLTFTALVGTRIRDNRDVDKLKFYLDNKNQLNEDAYVSQNIQIGLKQKAKREITRQSRKNQQAINLCNIDSYSLKDLKKMRENIERYYQFNLDDTPIIEIEDGPKLSRKKNF